MSDPTYKEIEEQLKKLSQMDAAAPLLNLLSELSLNCTDAEERGFKATLSGMFLDNKEMNASEKHLLVRKNHNRTVKVNLANLLALARLALMIGGDLREGNLKFSQCLHEGTHNSPPFYTPHREAEVFDEEAQFLQGL